MEVPRHQPASNKGSSKHANTVDCVEAPSQATEVVKQLMDRMGKIMDEASKTEGSIQQGRMAVVVICMDSVFWMCGAQTVRLSL